MAAKIKASVTFEPSMLSYLDKLVGNDTTPNRSAAIALLLEKGRRVFEKEQLLEAISSLDEGEQQETAEWGMDEYGADLEAEFPQQELWVPPSRLSQEQLHCDTDDDDALHVSMESLLASDQPRLGSGLVNQPMDAPPVLSSQFETKNDLVDHLMGVRKKRRAGKVGKVAATKKSRKSVLPPSGGDT